LFSNFHISEYHVSNHLKLSFFISFHLFSFSLLLVISFISILFKFILFISIVFDFSSVHFIEFHLISFDFIWFHLISFDFIWFHLISFILFHFNFNEFYSLILLLSLFIYLFFNHSYCPTSCILLLMVIFIVISLFDFAWFCPVLSWLVLFEFVLNYVTFDDLGLW
jgi:hypothetical protein